MGMKKFYVGVKGVIHDSRGYLILLKNEKVHRETVWEVPGGRIDDSEDFEEALRRELSEELPGIEVSEIKQLLGAYRLPKDIDVDTSLVLLYFLVEAIVPETVLLSDEHSEYSWVKSVSDIPSDGINDEIRQILTALVN
jgi:8-oxo-dGTP diphosphatase